MAFVLPLLVLLALPTRALAHGGAEETTPEAAPVGMGARDAGAFHIEASAVMGDPVEVTFRIQRRIDPPDPLLGALAPATDATVSVTLIGGASPIGPIGAHPEGEAGVYGVHLAGVAPGVYTVQVMVIAPNIPTTSVEFPMNAEAGHPGHDAAPTGHHAMTHPFLTHMGIPDGPGETSVRLTYIGRANGTDTGTDLAFHVEAGVVPRLGLHLRNDAVTGKASSENGHGTELMVMYSLLQDKAVTRGVSLFAETAVPTVRGDGPTITAAAGVGARYMWKSRLLLDGIVHVDPMEGLDRLGFEYEASAQVRVAGRVFLLVEDSGEAGAMEMTNYLLPAVKVGLGKSGGTIGAGTQFALTKVRALDRQSMFQMDWAF